MIVFTAKITSTMITAANLKKIKNIANRLSGLQVRDNLKTRFEGRKRGLKFRRRVSSYEEKKRKATGQNNPLVFTGAMRRNVITKARVTATSTGVRVLSTTGVRGFRTSEWRAQVRQELEQISKVEENQIVREHAKNLASLMQSPRFLKVKTFKHRRF